MSEVLICDKCGADLEAWDFNRLGEHKHFPHNETMLRFSTMIKLEDAVDNLLDKRELFELELSIAETKLRSVK